MKKISIYIHIPFCRHKCIYCDFYSIITDESINEYIAALCQEIEYYSVQNNYEVETIYFGGGTPSLLSANQIENILNHIRKNFYVQPNAETTIETNPGTVDLQKLIDFRQIEINRISIGVQTFDENELKFLTRIHDKNSAVETVLNAEKAGFANINLDLIFNLPGQTKNIWKQNLEKAIELPITHISTYSLILERGTILNKMVLDGKVVLQDDDYDADLYEYTIDFLTKKGFIQYEVSNFCKSGFECLHNLNYWQHKNYLGFGTSSHSFLDNKRWWNYSSLKMYIENIKRKKTAVRSFEILNINELEQEYIMLAMRSKGINIKEFINKFGEDFFIRNKNHLDEIVSKGYLIQTDEFFRLTQKGFLVCDEILINLK
ncbi:MAG: coproporphyrinogen III oxidase [Ignavibacteriales bacterium CG_4_9_14_3_um_filter_34_10]|nr:MAG: coproporphyrinogen III oxidase [Ignavibacteriales bacterium CG_4_9_14_3_um_filter_34_10]